MVSIFVKRLVKSNREFILREVLEVKGLMHVIMKHHNTGQKWSKEEREEIMLHLREISRIIPAVFIFLLPGGSLLLPFLAEVLDRRGNNR